MITQFSRYRSRSILPSIHPGLVSGTTYGFFEELSGTFRPTLQASGVLTAGRVYYYPFRCGQTITPSSVYLEITTAVAASNMRLGIYANSNGVPAGSPLWDSGDVATATTGNKTASISNVTLVAGNWYWLAVHNSAAIAFQSFNGGTHAGIGFSSAGSATLYGCWIETKSYGALAAPGTLAFSATPTSGLPPRAQFLI